MQTLVFKYYSLFKSMRAPQRDGRFQGLVREHTKWAQDIFCQKVKVHQDQWGYNQRKHCPAVLNKAEHTLWASNSTVRYMFPASKNKKSKQNSTICSPKDKYQNAHSSTVLIEHGISKCPPTLEWVNKLQEGWKRTTTTHIIDESREHDDEQRSQTHKNTMFYDPIYTKFPNRQTDQQV